MIVILDGEVVFDTDDDRYLTHRRFVLAFTEDERKVFEQMPALEKGTELHIRVTGADLMSDDADRRDLEALRKHLTDRLARGNDDPSFTNGAGGAV
jgi:hypothetical protein